jgi:hypothetical protein
MQVRMKLAAVIAAGGAAVLLAGGPALASTPAAHPAWVTGPEVIHGALHGRAAFIEASRKNTRVPVRFRGIVRTRGVVGLSGSSGKHGSIRTAKGRFAVRFIRSHRSYRVVNRRICRAEFTDSVVFIVRPGHSTGVFHGATGRGAVRIRFVFNFPHRASGKCNFSSHARPRKHGGRIEFTAVVPRLTVR